MTATTESTAPDQAASRESAVETFRVVVFGHVDDPADLKRILTECAAVHPDDAMAAARSVPGILPMRLSRQTADAVARQVKLLGIQATTLPENELPQLDHSELVHHLRIGPAGLDLVDVRGNLKRRVNWSDLSLLSVGCVPLADGIRFSAEPQVVLHAAPNPYHAVVETGHRDVLVLWLVCERPCQAYHVIHNQLNYEYLGERRTASATRNFNLLINDLVWQAPHAFLTPASRAFLHHGLRRHFEFHSADELRDYTALHMLVQRSLRTSPEFRRDNHPYFSQRTGKADARCGSVSVDDNVVSIPHASGPCVEPPTGRNQLGSAEKITT